MTRNFDLPIGEKSAAIATIVLDLARPAHDRAPEVSAPDHKLAAGAWAEGYEAAQGPIETSEERLVQSAAAN